MRFRNRKKKTPPECQSTATNSSQPNNSNNNDDDEDHVLNSDELEIKRLLDETLTLLAKNDAKKIHNLDSFKRFEKILKQKQKISKLSKLVTQLFSYWDIILLLSLNVLFASYLIFFFSVYYSPNPQIDVTEKLTQAKNWLIAKWLYFDGFTDLTKESCALVAPEIASIMFRPINDCSMCANLKEIQKIESTVSKEEFLREYAYTGIPVVISGAISNWTALNSLNFQFLKELYAKKEDTSAHRNASIPNTIMESVFNSIVSTPQEVMREQEKDVCQFFPYKTKFRDLSEVLAMELDEDNQWPVYPWYVGWSNCNSQAAQVLRKHYERPSFLPDEAEMSRLDWIFMGTPGYGAGMHIDDVDNPSWQAQISGIKHWTCKINFSFIFTCD